jgi:transcriptional regulator with XRE-family HTH domain
MDEQAHGQHLERVRQLGSYLEDRRISMGISQREMSRRTGIAQSQLSRLESGSYDLDLGLRFLPLLSKGYEVHLSELIERVFPELVHQAPVPDVVTLEVRPTRAYERSLATIQEGITALRTESAGIVELQKRIETMWQGMEALRSSQEAVTEQITEALAVVMMAAKDFNALREAMASMSISRHGVVPSPHPIAPRDPEEEKPPRRAKRAASDD